MFLPQEESKQFSLVSALFTISFSVLLFVGCLSMVFANFSLGALLFFLGLALVAGNEYMLLSKGASRPFPQASASSGIEGLVLFSLASFSAAAAIAYAHYLAYGGSDKAIVAIACGLLASVVKIASASLQFFLREK
ncbi:MAG: hypothetical protein N3F07_01525 [Candidatus Micrarchaeota archaeon]|nr:hypothetical protein [Candidatus Micrarchaeota archaeon]